MHRHNSVTRLSHISVNSDERQRFEKFESGAKANNEAILSSSANHTCLLNSHKK